MDAKRILPIFSLQRNPGPAEDTLSLSHHMLKNMVKQGLNVVYEDSLQPELVDKMFLTLIADPRTLSAQMEKTAQNPFILWDQEYFTAIARKNLDEKENDFAQALAFIEDVAADVNEPREKIAGALLIIAHKMYLSISRKKDPHANDFYQTIKSARARDIIDRDEEEIAHKLNLIQDAIKHKLHEVYDYYYSKLPLATASHGSASSSSEPMAEAGASSAASSSSSSSNSGPSTYDKFINYLDDIFEKVFADPRLKDQLFCTQEEFLEVTKSYVDIATALNEIRPSSALETTEASVDELAFNQLRLGK